MDASKKYNNPNKGKKRYKKDSTLSFVELGNACNIVLADFNLAINVEGYDEFLLDYIEMNETNPEAQFELIKTAILWQDYLNSIKSLMLYAINEKESDYERYKDMKTSRKRKNLMKDMMDLTTAEIKILKLYLMSLESQIELCGKIQYYLKKDYGKSVFNT